MLPTCPARVASPARPRHRPPARRPAPAAAVLAAPTVDPAAAVPCKAAAFAASTHLALGLPLSWPVLGTMAAAGYITCVADRMKVTPGDEAARGPHVRFMRRHAPARRASLAAAACALAAAVVRLPAAFAAGLPPLVATGLLYAAPLPFLGGHGMRTAPAGKALSACSVWAAACVGLPVAAAQGGVAAPRLAAMAPHAFAPAMDGRAWVVKRCCCCCRDTMHRRPLNHALYPLHCTPCLLVLVNLSRLG